MYLRFDGVELSFTKEPPVAVLPDRPSVMEDRQRAAVELGRLAALGIIFFGTPRVRVLQDCAYVCRT